MTTTDEERVMKSAQRRKLPQKSTQTSEESQGINTTQPKQRASVERRDACETLTNREGINHAAP